jgi:hypothetical protein
MRFAPHARRFAVALFLVALAAAAGPAVLAGDSPDVDPLADAEPLRLKTVEFDAPIFTLHGEQSWQPITAATTQLFGRPVSVELTDRRLELRIGSDDRPIRISARRGKEIDLPLGDDRELPIRIERRDVPGWLRDVPAEGLAPAWIAYPYVASSATFESGATILCLDADADGRYWEFGEDALVYDGRRWSIPLESLVIAGLDRHRLAVREDDDGERELLLVATETMTGVDNNDGELRAAMRWNGVRADMGLKPAWLDTELSKDCAAHCLYLKHNPDRTLSAHSQDPAKPHASPGGAAAARASCISFRDNPTVALNRWLSSLYHKRPLLNPLTERFGLAGRNGHSLADGTRGLGRDAGVSWPIPAPNHAQTVDILAYSGELPNPLPEGADGAGASILLMFESWDAPVRDVSATLHRLAGRDRWVEVGVWVSDPTRPANSARPKNDGCICLFPKSPLAPRSTYRPRIEYTDTSTGETRVVEWAFMTR